ncbi:Calx-beta domain-containing protein [uncultured Thiothrix sp.]|uniref:Calx-beta domain-containing protein n=1 Tax=uncultured Thiothrix sp. TaxID=223185 RepID=UPI0026367E27|nr:Calx-beta domain-containing protein [uncultured Thiothrix sp.]
MNQLKPLICFLASLSWLVAPSVQAAQSVQPVVTTVFADSQATVPVNLSYTVTSPDTENTVGLALRVHYNSTALDFVNQTPYASQLQPIGTLSDDTQNLDGDLSTDKYWVLAWVDINATWPGTGKTPLNLLSSNFKTKAGFAGSTAVRLTAASTANNTNFQTSPLVICAKPTVSISASDALANEKNTNTASFQVSLAAALPLECGNLKVNYQVTGTATAGSDYTALTGSVTIPAGSQQATILATPLADSSTEADESIILTLQTNNNYQLASSTQASAILQDASVSSLPTVTLTSAKTQVLEGTDTSLNLTLTRQTNDLSQALTVYLQTSGSATVGSDYQALPSSVTILAGQTQANLVLNLLNDTQQEQQESLKINLTTNSAYQLADLSRLDLTLLDDETLSNTDLALNSNNAQSIPSLSQSMLIVLSTLLALLAFTQARLRQRLKLGAKA